MTNCKINKIIKNEKRNIINRIFYPKGWNGKNSFDCFAGKLFTLCKRIQCSGCQSFEYPFI